MTGPAGFPFRVFVAWVSESSSYARAALQGTQLPPRPAPGEAASRSLGTGWLKTKAECDFLGSEEVLLQENELSLDGTRCVLGTV